MWPSKNITLFFTALLLLFRTSSLFSQCVPTGALLPSTAANDNSIGSVTWSNLVNCLSSNNSYATGGTLLGVLGSAQTNYIQALNHNFAIPSTATVCGIEVRVERSAAGLLIGSSVKDKNVFLIQGGVPVGSNHASASNWAGSDAITVYGSNSDLWGTTWTPAQINAANFGVAFSAQLNAGLVSLFLSANVDMMSVTVYYTASTLPVEFISFSGQPESQAIRLQWQTASEKNNARFDVEKMNEDYSWHILESVAGKSNSSGINSYTVYDQNPVPLNYYRVRQVDGNSQSSLSENISVEYSIAPGSKPTIYPIPAGNVLYIDYSSSIQNIEVISANGISVKTEIQEQERGARLNIASLPAGIYFLKIYTRSEVIMTRFIKE